MIFTSVPPLRCELQRSYKKKLLVKRRKKRVADLILAHYDVAELVFVALRCNSSVPDTGCAPNVLVTFGRHDSSSSAFAAVIADLSSGPAKVARPTETLNHGPY